jgi:hypothetical protein
VGVGVECLPWEAKGLNLSRDRLFDKNEDSEADRGDLAFADAAVPDVGGWLEGEVEYGGGDV